MNNESVMKKDENQNSSYNNKTTLEYQEAVKMGFKGTKE
jgi:hypothetical protein